MEKTAAIFVTYNHVPEWSVLKTVLFNLDYLVIIDNASESEVRKNISLFCQKNLEKCLLILKDRNVGISRAYNEAVDYLKPLGVHWIYFFDHDAIFTDELIVQTRKHFDEFVSKKFGLLVPIVSDRQSLLNAHLFNGSPLTVVHNAITSGMLTSIDVFQKVKGFDDDFFVEGADYAFSQRIAKAGFGIIRINQVLIVQKFEEKPNGHRSLRRLFDRIIEFRSIIRVGIGNSNIFRTTVSYYNPTRGNELKTSLNLLKSKFPDDRRFIMIVSFLTFAERILVSALSRSSGTER